jgi:hypothetical protein
MKKTILFLAFALIGSATFSSCEKEEIKPTYSSNTSSGSGGSSSSGGSGCTTVQCSSYTQAGNRCQRMTTNCNGRCWQHQ